MGDGGFCTYAGDYRAHFVGVCLEVVGFEFGFACVEVGFLEVGGMQVLVGMLQL